MDRDKLLKTVRELFKDKPSIIVREQAFLGSGGARSDFESLVVPPSHIVVVVEDHPDLATATGWVSLQLSKSKIPFKQTYEHGWIVFVLT